jgi:MurNAc alpha-1-phosphate uridylyltransferase
MRAMILAAGRGERMRPLTDSLPKPLLEAGGKPLIVWHIENLARAGVRDIVVNHAWLGELIEQRLGDGSRWGVNLRYSPEKVALETAGGIAQALPCLGDAPFLVVNGDVWCDWDASQAQGLADGLGHDDAWLLLVDNPAHHPEGDFQLAAHGRVRNDLPSAGRLTFAGVGIYRPRLFAGVAHGTSARLAPLLIDAMARGTVAGSLHTGRWVDVGTPGRLAELDASLQ